MLFRSPLYIHFPLLESVVKILSRRPLPCGLILIIYAGCITPRRLQSTKLSFAKMEWPAGRELDKAFGPRLPHAFDLTFRFEHIFLTIVPSLVFIFAALCYLRYYVRQPSCTRSGGLKWVELVRFFIVSCPSPILSTPWAISKMDNFRLSPGS